jgi:arginine utilization protein RocB
MTVSEITAAKAEFALALADAGLDVVDYIPGRVVPPVVIISSSSPYITTESLGNDYELNLDLKCVAMTADNQMATNALDLLVEQVFNALSDLHYIQMKQVNQPYALEANGAVYLAADVGVMVSITL